ncbi:transposase [Lysinibacillus sp. ZYM-1]|uniref:IS66 family transposase n=1 Tax=Lysinibacillus sp. ZYM-1 TaxID=1681184 RepID=UPI000AA52E75|nr:transposase [Lysinibacillus sp. ZYM-1]
MKQQNKDLSKQIEVLTEQVRYLTKLLYGSKTEKSKYTAPDGQIGVKYCDDLYRLERKFKHMSPGKRRKQHKKHSKPIVEKFLDWVEKSLFYGKNALAKAAEYTLNRVNGLKAFLNDGRIEIDNNPAENAIRPNVIGRKNWLFSVSEAGAKANAICLSIAETVKANGVDFYQYLMKLMTDLPNLDIHRNLEILNQYMPWSKKHPSCMRKIK